MVKKISSGLCIRITNPDNIHSIDYIMSKWNDIAKAAHRVQNYIGASLEVNAPKCFVKEYNGKSIVCLRVRVKEDWSLNVITNNNMAD